MSRRVTLTLTKVITIDLAEITFDSDLDETFATVDSDELHDEIRALLSDDLTSVIDPQDLEIEADEFNIQVDDPEDIEPPTDSEAVTPPKTR